MRSYNTGKSTYSWILLACLVGSQFCYSNVSAQGVSDKNSPISQNFAITQFGMEDGLPQSTVRDIIQARDGYIWLATFGGLVRFDGHSFTTFNRSNTPGMESDRFLKVFEDKAGGLWLFPEEARSDVCRFKNGQCTNYELSNKPIQGSNIHEDDAGNVWIQADSTMWRYSGEELVKVKIKTDAEAIEKALQDPGGVWIGYQNDVLKTTGAEIARIDQDFPIPGNDRIIQITKHPQKPGHILIGTSMNGILEVDENRNVIARYDLPYNYFLVFKPDQDKNIFGLTAQGLILFDKGEFKKFTPFDPEDEVMLKSILQDNEGNYWVGTEGDGLFKLRRTVISMIDKENGLENDKMLSLTKLKDGTMLFSSNCGGIFEWKDGQATLSAVQNHFKSPCNWSVYQDSKNRIWVGGANPYVTSALDEPGKEFKAEDGYDAYTVFAMMEDSKGQMWISTSNGIFIYDEGFKKTYTIKDGLYFDHVSSLLEDSDGVIWAGGKAGLNTIQGDQVLKVPLLEEYFDGQEIIQPWVRAIYEDQDGVMWFGTYGHGLFSLKDGEVTNITEQSGLFDNIVSHIVEDENGFFWMGSNRGISRVNRNDLLKFIDGDIDEVRSYSYGTAEGMNSAETNGGFQPSTITDSLGNIYFPTVAGVAVVSTRDVKQNEDPPPVFIEHLKSTNGELSDSSAITLPYDNSYLEISYTALSYSAPEKVAFKYQMKGLDESWIDVGNRRTALYTKIPPGEYTFQVIASNNDGVWNNEGASIAISVIPPFWQTWWFYIMFGVLFISMGSGIYYYKMSQLKKENERKKWFSEQLIKSQEQERRRIAKELHDGLGQQILVIKNRAEFAQDYIHKPDEVANQLKEIMLSAMSSIGDVRNISHGLLPVHLEKFGLKEAIMNLCDQLKRTSSVDWSYHVDDIDGLIPRDKEINFYRIIQEAINNILKHAEASEASVIIKKTSAGVSAVIMDDGKGFDLRLKNSLSGMGLLGMEERMESLAGKLRIESAPGNGTVIRILIPSEQHEKV